MYMYMYASTSSVSHESAIINRHILVQQKKKKKKSLDHEYKDDIDNDLSIIYFLVEKKRKR